MSKVYGYDKKSLIRDLRRGHRNIDVAAKYGISPGLVSRIKFLAGLTKRGKPPEIWSSEEIDLLVKASKNGLTSYQELTKKLPNRTLTAIKVKSKRLGIDKNFYHEGRKAIKPKQEFYRELANYYKSHTRKQTLEFCKRHGYNEIFFKHFLWRIWPKIRENPKSKGGSLRYNTKDVCAFLMASKDYSFGSDGLHYRSSKHVFSKLGARFKSIRYYWGVPNFYAKKLLCCESNRVGVFLPETKKYRSDGKGTFLRYYSWIELNKFLSENLWFRKSIDRTTLRCIAIMARFEMYLNQITKDFNSPKEALDYLIKRRAMHGIESAKKSVESATKKPRQTRI